MSPPKNVFASAQNQRQAPEKQTDVLKALKDAAFNTLEV